MRMHLKLRKQSSRTPFEWIHKLRRWSKDSGMDILSMEAHEDNRDGFAVRWMGKRLENRPETHKFLTCLF